MAEARSVERVNKDAFTSIYRAASIADIMDKTTRGLLPALSPSKMTELLNACLGIMVSTFFLIVHT